MFPAINHVFPRERARKRKRERTRSSNFLPRRSISSSMLDYEKLDVYRIALEFVVTTIEIRDRLPRGNGELQDQFKRASFSIVLNIAEGAGKLKQADKRRYFSIARGSVMDRYLFPSHLPCGREPLKGVPIALQRIETASSWLLE